MQLLNFKDSKISIFIQLKLKRYRWKIRDLWFVISEFRIGDKIPWTAQYNVFVQLNWTKTLMDYRNSHLWPLGKLAH